MTDLQEPLLDQKKGFFISSFQTKQITLKELVQLINNYQEAGYQVEDSVNSFLQIGLNKKNSHEIEKKYGLKEAKWAFYTQDKKYAFIIQSQNEITQVLVKTEEKTQIEAPNNTSELICADASSSYLFMGFKDTNILKYDIKVKEWTVLQKVHDAGIHCMTITPNQKYLITSSDDQVICF